MSFPHVLRCVSVTSCKFSLSFLFQKKKKKKAARRVAKTFEVVEWDARRLERCVRSVGFHGDAGVAASYAFVEVRWVFENGGDVSEENPRWVCWVRAVRAS